MSPLRQQMIADMQLRGLAPRTQKAYLAVVEQLAGYYHQSPAYLTQNQIHCYLLHLIEERKLAWSSTNQAACALRFLYHTTLHQPDTYCCIPARKTAAKLPEILSPDEVARLLDACLLLKHRALLMTTYAAGLRVSETCALKVDDIDSERMMLRIEGGKGGRDRYSLLSPLLLATLRQYWRAERPRHWLFAKGNGSGPIDVSHARKAFYRAKQRAGIHKEGGIHSLRHAFATHLLEAGVDIHTIGRLMGHDKITTTARYLHLRQQQAKTNSPLDLLSALKNRQ
ncbi:site-specific integrase [Noviherbaspirillum sp.]|uniref:site-specific integrase n=1 Tax=Noviherbaspirillum sp. TaxID=1926288 RepID=UPI002FE19D93